MQCKECGEEMALGSMEGNMRTQHGRAEEGIRSWAATTPVKEPRMYRMALPTVGGLRNCPVKGCMVRAAIRTASQVHFPHRHIRDTVSILEEGNPPHPRCPR